MMAAMTHGINPHPGDDELERYAMGLLPESEVAPFEEHLLLCETCRHRLHAADDYTGAMQGASAALRKRDGMAPVRVRQPIWTWLRLIPAVAALGILVVVLGWWSRSSDLDGPPFAISLAATRGVDDGAWVPAGTWLLVRLDLAGLPDYPSYSIEMVNDTGIAVWHGDGKAVDAKIESRIPQTKPGAYFIRVYSPSGELLREFGLKVR